MQNSYDSRLIFDNSLTENSYTYSRGASVAPSSLELLDGKLPVASEHFFSPPNSLKLAWRSKTGGDLHAEIDVERWRSRSHQLAGDSLSIWCYSEAPIDAHSLPILIVVGQGGRHTLPLRLGRVAGKLPGRRWVQVNIPFDAFGGSTGDLGLPCIEKLIVMQSVDD